MLTSGLYKQGAQATLKSYIPTYNKSIKNNVYYKTPLFTFAWPSSHPWDSLFKTHLKREAALD